MDTSLCGSNSTLILINESLTTELQAKRGLRQGDSLSPFLYLIAAESFAGLMKSVCALEYFHLFKFSFGTSTYCNSLMILFYLIMFHETFELKISHTRGGELCGFSKYYFEKL